MELLFVLIPMVALVIVFAIAFLVVIMKRAKNDEGPLIMGKNNAPLDGERLSVVYRNGGGFYGPRREIWLDSQTGVQYLMVTTNYGTSVTPLLDRDGRPYCGR